MKNGIIGRPVENPEMGVIHIPLMNKEMVDLALSRDDTAWDTLCDILVKHGFMDIRGNMHVDWLIIDGVKRVFH
jgi:hypothetical protein|tara:strand:+ start:322 stop:543 length:222 start_codon:yes stop_codon:yes gene_type:complete